MTDPKHELTADTTGPAAAAEPPEWTGAESDAAFEELGDRIIDATRRFNRSSRRHRIQSELYTIDGKELSLAQVDALEALKDGESRMHELATRLGIDPSTATRTTAPLVDLELLERYTDPANRRYVVLRCTTRGLETIDWLIEQRRTLMREVLAPMNPQRRLLFAELFDEFTSLTEQYRAAPPLDEP